MSEKPPIADTIRMMDIVDRLQRLRNDGAREQQGDEALLQQVRQIYLEQGLSVDEDIINKAFFELRGRNPQALVPTNASVLFKLQSKDGEEDLFNETEESDWEEEFLTEELSDLLPEEDWGDGHGEIQALLVEPSGFEMVMTAGVITTLLLSFLPASGWIIDQSKQTAPLANPVTCSDSQMACTADVLISTWAVPVSWASIVLGLGCALIATHAILGLWRPHRKHRVWSMVWPALLAAAFLSVPAWVGKL